jgi:hypothetical protein
MLLGDTATPTWNAAHEERPLGCDLVHPPLHHLRRDEVADYADRQPRFITQLFLFGRVHSGPASPPT